MTAHATAKPVLQLRKPKLINASSVVPKAIHWFWFPYIPRGCVTIMFGIGGIGKSHVTWDIVARASSGEKMPGQKRDRKPQKVLMLSAEDDPERVLVPGLIQQEARLRNIAFPVGPLHLDEAGCKKLEAAVLDFGAELVVIDPVVAYMGSGIDMWRANEVRGFLAPLNDMANRLDITIVIVAHERKGDDGSDVDHMMGSADFANACRSALRVFIADDGCYVVRHAKHNYSKAGPSLTFENHDGKFIWLGQWEGEEEDRQSKPGKPAKGRQMAEKFLKETLKDGPMPAKELEQLARDAKIAPATLNRAKIGIAESFAARNEGKMTWWWRLTATEGAPADPKTSKTAIHIGKDSGNAPTEVHNVASRARTPLPGDRRAGDPVSDDAEPAGLAPAAVPPVERNGPEAAAAGEPETVDAATSRRALIHDWLRQEGIM